MSEKEVVEANVQQRGSLVWRKSTASASGACVEIARAGGMMLVRDSKDPVGSVLTFSGVAWEAFLGEARAGQFDT